MVNGGREETPLEAVEWIRRLESLGAGEILLTSMDRDGTRPRAMTCRSSCGRGRGLAFR